MKKGILSISAKCTDMCTTSFTDSNGHISTSDGYVPRNIGIGGGDYIVMDIDMETGQILNWKPVSDYKVLKEQIACE